MITWRKITTEDYKCILIDWWKAWDWDFIPAIEDCPEGYIISKDGVDTYAGFLYYSGTSIAWMGFNVSNRKASLEEKRGCFEKLIDVISIIAKSRGVKMIFANSQNMDYCNSLKKNGFIIGDVGVTHLIKKL